MTTLFTAYLCGYSLACVVAIGLMIRERAALILFRPEYRKFIASGWKLVTLPAGLLWNLQRDEGRGVVFGTMVPRWPGPSSESGFRQIVWYAMLMVLMTMMSAPF